LPSGWGFFQKISQTIVSPQQGFHLATQFAIAAARPIQKRGAILDRNFDRPGKDSYVAAGIVVIHEILTPFKRFGRGSTSPVCYISGNSRQKGQTSALKTGSV
jgi:hypothetical protein